MSPFQWVFNVRRCSVNESAEFRLELVHLLLHAPGHLAVAEMAFHSTAQPRDVFRLSKIHLEEKSRATSEWKQILSSRPRQSGGGSDGGPHSSLVFPHDSCG